MNQTVEIGLNVYRVWWDHRQAPKVTICRIKRGRADFTREQWDAAPFFEGEALLNPRDHYNRNTGRKITLARALKNIVPRDDRARFWTAYREQLGHW